MASKALEKAREQLTNARKAIRKHSGGRKGVVWAAGTGFAAYELVKITSERFEMVRNNWWGPSAVMVGTAIALQKKLPASVMYGLAGAAGYSAGQNYALVKGAEKAPAPSTETKGYDDYVTAPEPAVDIPYDTGAVQYPDTGAVQNPGGGSARRIMSRFQN